MSSLILAGNAYSNFVNTIKSEATLVQYVYGLKRYLLHLNLSDVNDLLTFDQKTIQTQIINYILMLKKERKISATTIGLYVAAVIHFYAMNDVIVNRKKIGMYIGEYIKKQKDKAYTNEQIQRLLDFSDERSKALILLLTSTGMRIGAIADLRLSHITRIKEYDLYRISVYEGTREEYFCYTTPEAAKSLDIYLEYRTRSGEKLTEKSPLFREQFDVNDLEQIKLHPHAMTLNGLFKVLANILHRSGVMPTSKFTEADIHGRKRNSVARAHGFRKFVTTNFIRAKLNPVAKEMLLGHSTNLDKSYYRPNESELLEEYLKAVDLLTINEENRLKRKVVELTEKADMFDSLEEKIERLNKKLGLE
jgi:integrase